MVTAFCLSVIIVVCALIFARPALKKASKKGLAVFCAFAIAAAVSAQKANTNAPPDGASGPLSVPRLLSDSPADEPEGDAGGVTNLQFTSFSVTPTNLAAGLGWPLGLFATPTYLEIVAHYPELTNDSSLVKSVPVPFGATNVSFSLDAAMFGFTNGLPPAIFLDAVERASLANSSADHDRDQVIDSDEVAAGTDPFDSDTDDDGLSDGEELGSAQVLSGDDFLWFDHPGGRNTIANTDDFTSHTWKWTLDAEVAVNDIRCVAVAGTLDGCFHLVSATNTATYFRGYGYAGMDFRTDRYASGEIVIACLNADLYARRDRGRGLYHGSVETNGCRYSAFEFENIGLASCANGLRG